MQPNILLVRLDDVGKEQFRLLGLGTAPYPRIPNIERLMQNGVTFTRAYVNSQCSPTRAAWETGCRGQQTGVLTLVEAGAQPLLAGEVCIAAALDHACGEGVYAKALFGKWHLSTAQSRGGEIPHPIHAGYDYYDGQLRNVNAGEDYYSWTRVRAERMEAGVTTRQDMVVEYEPTYLVNAALAWIERTPQPWLLTYAPGVPHSPYNRPPAGMYDASTWSLPDITAPDGAGLSTKRAYFKGGFEAFDFELGRLLNGMGADVFGNTVVILWSDNGTSPDVIDDNVNGGHVKRSVFELGVNTPLIVSGPGVSSPGRRSGALIHATDLWATVIAISQGIEAVPLPSGHGRDSQSFWGVASGTADTHRTYVWTELCAQGQYISCQSSGARAIIYDRYKLMKAPAATGTTFPNPVGGAVVATDHFFDLEADPFENQDLIGAGSPFVSAGIITLTNTEPAHLNALSAYQTAVAQYALVTASLS